MPTRRVLTVLLGLLLVAGCGGGEEKSAPRPESSASPSQPPGLDTTEPELPPDAEETPASAAAYGRYVAELVQYAVRIRSARPVFVQALDQARCETCRELDSFIDQLQDGGYWEVGEDLRLGDFTAKRGPGGFAVRGSFVYPRAEFQTVTGTARSTAEEQPYRFTADLWWDDDEERWRLEDYSFLEEKGRA